MTEEFFKDFTYSNLNHLQVGKICEYWVKLFLTMEGLDIYTNEVDDKAIDFVIRLDGAIHVDVQVKSIRVKTTKYAFITKTNTIWSDVDIHRKNLYVALVLMKDGNAPSIYLIPATAWKMPNALLRNRNYSIEHKSKPEWGINISTKNMELLATYSFNKQVSEIRKLNSVKSTELDIS